MPSVNDVLSSMRKAGKVQDMKEKGDLGEEAVLAICLDRKKAVGKGLLYQSFMYPYQSDRSGRVYTGNVKYENGESYGVYNNIIKPYNNMQKRLRQEYNNEKRNNYSKQYSFCGRGHFFRKRSLRCTHR